MYSVKPRNTSTVGPDKSNVVGTQDNKFRIEFMNMLEVFKAEMNNPLNLWKHKEAVGCSEENCSRLAGRNRINKENRK